jgi:hypothetical protein
MIVDILKAKEQKKWKYSQEAQRVKLYLPGSIISAARCSELLDRENSDSFCFI